MVASSERDKTAPDKRDGGREGCSVGARRESGGTPSATVPERNRHTHSPTAPNPLETANAADTADTTDATDATESSDVRRLNDPNHDLRVCVGRAGLKCPIAFLL